LLVSTSGTAAGRGHDGSAQMSRVLITGGAGPLGAAIAKRLLGDPAYDVRISDAREAPQWMREGCEVHRGDLRSSQQALAAAKGCMHVIHLACFEQRGQPAEAPHALLEHEAALHNAIVRAALDRGVERFVYVSSPLVFERATVFPTREDHLDDCPPPASPRGFARLAGERLCAAASREHGLQYAICRPFGAYGPRPQAPGLSQLIADALAGEQPLRIFGNGEQTLTPTHVDDLAAGIIAALGSPAAANEDFNLSSGHELSLARSAQIAWAAGGAEGEPSFERLPAREGEPARSCPATEKARELLAWEARVSPRDGIAALAQAVMDRAGRGVAAAPVAS
jgi:UDP-glucose 4-epimerase